MLSSQDVQHALYGQVIVITRPEHQVEGFERKIREAGGTPLCIPAICLAPTEEHSALLQAIRDIRTFDWVLFTSVNGVRAVVRACGDTQVPPSVLAERQIVAIGPATAGELTRMGVKPSVIPEEYISDAIPELLGEVAGKRILLPRADIARKELPRELRERGAEVTEIAAYRIVANEDSTLVEMIRNVDDAATPDYLTFTSSSTVNGFYGLLEKAGKTEWFSQVPIVSIGPVTAATVRERGGESTLVAKSYTTDGILEVIIAREAGAGV